ncbi:UbiA family prenyltransferase [Nocardioides sp. SOB77]|uniref:UbiA family prenyltransferase n=1 Tax=Nocardioides oceani TaxID=3058369 RepID=A0ABT8FDC0_9ACTN|nr:UbiA family prenyltransferase [Nocardioides oceani]MDN4172681.1 UbiA family prenyltransferase [Nocardioides oceani]
MSQPFDPLTAPGEPAGRLDIPLVVDLDGTLMANDMLWETASRFLSQHPGRAHWLVRWAAQGKAHLKKELWAAAPVRVERLKYHAELVDWLREERARGRTLVLASASHGDAARAVADHLDLFDVVLGSDGRRNLRSDVKAQALLDLFDGGPFEYVGNSRHDLDVWRHATTAHLVSARRSLAARAASSSTVGRTFPTPPGLVRNWVRALRPHQWVKNLLVFLPLLASHRVGEPAALASTVMAFVAFCMAASSVYLLNDIADVEHDRIHPTKRARPFAAGTIGLGSGWIVWPLLALAGLALGLAVSVPFCLVLLVYLLVTAAYSFALKRQPVVDVLTLAGLYTIRIVAGGAAVGVELSVWLLGFSGFFFLSLALVKRVSELYKTRESQLAPNGRGYESQDLELLSSYGVATSVASVLVFTLFVDDPGTAQLYRHPQLLWFAVPVLLWWLMRVWLLAHRGQMDEDPILFAIKDRRSVICAGSIVAIFLVATLYPG